MKWCYAITVIWQEFKNFIESCISYDRYRKKNIHEFLTRNNLSTFEILTCKILTSDAH